MELSILIPTYNYVCTSLVQALCQQCEECKDLDSYEIIVADDGSTLPETLTANRTINTLPECHYVERGHNVGRSIILAEMVLQMRYPWIIIIDSDAEVFYPSYIQTYVHYAQDNQYDAICGGIETSIRYRRADNALRFNYEMHASDIRALKYRNAHPFMHLSTFNIMLRASMFQELNFNTQLTQYGYEDLLLGVDMEKHGKRMLHINNPLIHTGMDSNASYLHKTQLALQNLHIIEKQVGNYSAICKMYHHLQQWKLIPLLQLWHRLFCQREEKNLLGNHPNLFLFKLYKLGYFATLKK